MVAVGCLWEDWKSEREHRQIGPVVPWWELWVVDDRWNLGKDEGGEKRWKPIGKIASY